MPQIRPITDLRNTNEMSEFCHSRKEPVFITKNGYGWYRKVILWLNYGMHMIKILIK